MSARLVGIVVLVALPIVLLVALAILAASWVHVRPTGTRKVVLIHAFSGPLHDQGYDALVAVQVAIQQSTDARGLLEGERIELEALDDAGTSDGALRRLEAVASDAHVIGVLCCSSIAATVAASQQKSSESPGPAILYPAAPAPSSVSSAVATIVGSVQPSRPVLVNADAGQLGPFIRSVVALAHPTEIVGVDVGGGGSIEGSSARVLADRPDAVFLDLDVATASLLVGGLRDAGYSGPIAGPADLGCSEMVAWTGARLGSLLVPVRTRRVATGSFDQQFSVARGHAPSDDDRQFYAAARSMLRARASSQAPTNDEWSAAVLTPGRFPPHVLAGQ